VDWARGAQEDGDLTDLVALAMARERAIEKEQGPVAGGADSDDGGDGSGRRGGGGGGVVEFGDAEDEPDWEAMGRRGAGKKGGVSAAGAKQAQRGAGRKGAAGGGGGGGAKPVVAHRTGEMAHAGAPVPEAQRSVIFGDAGDADSAAADWEGLGLGQVLSDHLAALNFTAPTRVQRGALPPLLAGRDACVRAPTGSGKTLAYLAPIVQQLQARSGAWLAAVEERGVPGTPPP
jgi:hypothetical protein